MKRVVMLCGSVLVASAAICRDINARILATSALGKKGAVATSNRTCPGWISSGPQGGGDMSNFLDEKDCEVLRSS